MFENPSSYLFAILANNIIFASIFLSYTFGLNNIAKELKLFPREYYKKVFNYAIIILPVTLFSVVNSLVDKAFISNLLSISDLANYTSVFLLAGALQIIIMALNKSYMPKLLKHYSLEGYRALDLLSRDTTRFLLIVSLCFVCSIFLSPLLFLLLFDDSITFYPQIFIVLSLAFSFNSIYILYTNVLSLEEKTAKFKMFGFLIALCINIPLSYILTLNFGLFGAAVSTLLSTLVASSVLSLFVSKVVLRFYLLKTYLAFVTFMSLVAFSTIYFELYSFLQLG
jgi:O-antigen/teichoic acid export membrane protein